MFGKLICNSTENIYLSVILLFNTYLLDYFNPDQGRPNLIVSQIFWEFCLWQLKLCNINAVLSPTAAAGIEKMFRAIFWISLYLAHHLTRWSVLASQLEPVIENFGKFQVDRVMTGRADKAFYRDLPGKILIRGDDPVQGLVIQAVLVDLFTAAIRAVGGAGVGAGLSFRFPAQFPDQGGLLLQPSLEADQLFLQVPAGLAVGPFLVAVGAQLPLDGLPGKLDPAIDAAPVDHMATGNLGYPVSGENFADRAVPG